MTLKTNKIQRDSRIIYLKNEVANKKIIKFSIRSGITTENDFLEN